MNKNQVSTGLTGFIDILGFGDRVLAAKTFDDIEEIRTIVKRIQSEFDFDAKDPITKEVHSLYGKTVLAFSDCVVVNIPLRSKAIKSEEDIFDEIMGELHGFAYAQGTCVLDKLFLRGGLDIGWWYRSGSTLISPSMVCAYRTESYANVPVLALSQETYNFVANQKGRNFYSPERDPMKSSFRKYEENVGDQRREFWYLDYISICVESVDWQSSEAQVSAYRAASPDEKDEIARQGYLENTDGWLEHHARNIEEAYAAADIEKIKQKYRWLASYHNEVATEFTSNPKSICYII